MSIRAAQTIENGKSAWITDACPSAVYSTYTALTGLANRDRPCPLQGINKSFIYTVDKCQLLKGYLRAETTLPYQVQTSTYHP